MLPTRILRLLEFVGFSGNKVTTCFLGPRPTQPQDRSSARRSGAEGPQGPGAVSGSVPLSVWPWTRPKPLWASVYPPVKWGQQSLPGPSQRGGSGLGWLWRAALCRGLGACSLGLTSIGNLVLLPSEAWSKSLPLGPSSGLGCAQGKPDYASGLESRNQTHYAEALLRAGT